MTLGAFGLAPFRLGRSLWWPLERALEGSCRGPLWRPFRRADRKARLRNDGWAIPLLRFLPARWLRTALRALLRRASPWRAGRALTVGRDLAIAGARPGRRAVASVLAGLTALLVARVPARFSRPFRRARGARRARRIPRIGRRPRMRLKRLAGRRRTFGPIEWWCRVASRAIGLRFGQRRTSTHPHAASAHRSSLGARRRGSGVLGLDLQRGHAGPVGVRGVQ